MSSQENEVLLAKQEIRDVLSRYSRGLDRMDKEMAYSVWHDNGTALYYDMFEGTGHGFVDWVWEAHVSMQCHSHQITNVLTEVDGDTAVSEAYVTVVLWTLADTNGKQMEIVGRGRYLDRWSKREGSWAIDHREHVLDMQTLHELNKGEISKQSTRDLNDASFQFIKKH
jgi:hypothetical protein